MDFEYEYLILIPIGFVAGFLNTIAGGGTLLTLPTLIFWDYLLQLPMEQTE